MVRVKLCLEVLIGMVVFFIVFRQTAVSYVMMLIYFRESLYN
uniref:Uncharacterized protein n=1 Tax=Arundo donax TaxID=35708 RepID=A0A0A9H6U4_ARUDO